MCGRYTMFTQAEALVERFHAVLPSGIFAPTYNAAPSQEQLTILSADPHKIALSAWGFVPEWAAGRSAVKPLINARAETVATKPFFRQAFQTKRCLVLADGFYEWKRLGKRRIPHRIACKTGEPFAFAGIWSSGRHASGQEQTTFAILTTEANALVAQIHNRMPVILHEQDEAAWLNRELSSEDAQAMLTPFPAERLIAYEVTTKINSPAYNTPAALQPVAPAQE